MNPTSQRPSPQHEGQTIEARYYRSRADAHAGLANHADADAASVHVTLSERYRSAAAALELGGSVDFAGEHRAERPGSFVR